MLRVRNNIYINILNVVKYSIVFEVLGDLIKKSLFTEILLKLFQFIMGNFLYWRTVALINTAAPSIAFCALFLVPESPYWLATKNRVDEARKSLAWLRGWVSNVCTSVRKSMNKK